MHQPYLLVAGCSHTKGIGIDQQSTWAKQVSTCLELELVNLSESGASALYVKNQLDQWLQTHQHNHPTFIIVQWPNPFRSFDIKDNKTYFYNAHTSDKKFLERLKTSPGSFWVEWMNSIIELNRNYQIPILNLCLESKDMFTDQLEILSGYGIELHIDEKTPDKTWHFDSMAEDRLHHSSECHRKWADRILTILKSQL